MRASPPGRACAPAHGFVGTAFHSASHSVVSRPGRAQRENVRLHRQPQCLAGQSEPSSYSDGSIASRASKALVSGLTAVVNLVVPPDRPSSSTAVAEQASLSPEEVLAGVKEDFTTNCYLWTGRITEHIYDAGVHFAQLSCMHSMAALTGVHPAAGCPAPPCACCAAYLRRCSAPCHHGAACHSILRAVCQLVRCIVLPQLLTPSAHEQVSARADCTFTDPTISFRGLATFQRNLASLRPLVNRLLRHTDVQLRSCDLDEGARTVTARWRMVGDFVLPWKPRLDIRGCTTFTYDPDRGNHIVSYDETWDVPASQALLQLLKPGQRHSEG